MSVNYIIFATINYLVMARRKDDMLLKSVFEEVFPDLLRFFFPHADELFDIEKGFAFLDKELMELFPEIERRGGNRFADMLVKVFLRGEDEEWILVHIEIEASGSPRFPGRMYQYWYRICDRYEAAVTALAVFTGGPNQRRSDCLVQNFLGTELSFRYNTYHIFEHDEDALLKMRNPFAFVVLAARLVALRDRLTEEELGRQRLAIARKLVAGRRYDHERVLRILYFIKTYIHIENQKINDNFDKETERLTGKIKAMGIIETIKLIYREEGIEQGIEQGRRIFVLNLLAAGKFTVAEIANFAGVSESFVRKIEEEQSHAGSGRRTGMLP